jgi:hypothetical protein
VPWAVLAILATPFGWYLAGSATLYQNGYLDPWFYTSYVNHYGDMLDRYGMTYFATRIAYLFPERALGAVFGSEGGYYAWHYLLAVAALGAVYAIARRLQGVPTAVVVTTFLVVCPWLPRALVWDYVDGAGIAFMLVGIYFLLASRAPMPVRWAAAGAFFSLAVNANLFLASIIGIFGLSWLCFGFRSRSVRRRLVAVGWLVGAALTVQLALATFMAIAYPTAGFFYVGKSFDITSNLLQRNDPATYKPLGEVLRISPYVMVPALGGIAAIGFALVARVSEMPEARRAFIRMVALFAAGCGALFLALELSHQAVAYLPYYVDYLIPAFTLGAIVIVGELMRLLSPRWQRLAAGATVAGLLGTYVVLQNWTIGAHDFGRALFAAGVVAVMIIVLGSRFARPLALVVALAVLVVTPFAFLVRDNGEYVRVASGQTRPAEWDVYRAAHRMQDDVLAAVPGNQTVGFWYGSEPSLSSIQSMFLYNRTMVFPPGDWMPHVTPVLLENVRRFDYLVLLGVTPGAVAEGTRALCAAGQPLREVGRRTVTGDDVDLTFAIFRVETGGGCTGTGAAA